MPIQAQAIPLSLYIHLPWCVRKCPYCDFNSHVLRNEVPETQYIDALLTDLKQDLAGVNQRKLQSIFFGGGTPSLFSGDAINKILLGVKQYLDFSDDIEITLEANPGTVERKYFAEYFLAGVNRLSLGVQSFQDDKLKSLGRIHCANEAKNSVSIAEAAGFTNFNIDLMFGLPSQTVEDALFDLRQAIDLNPTHISWYQLTLEPNTLFAAKPPVLPDEDCIWEMQQQGQTLLAEHGFEQYEVSAYAKIGKQSRHNLNYWLFGDYLGIGAGAHSKITMDNCITRQWKHKHPKDYLNLEKKFIGEKKIIPGNELAFEFMLNALRLNQAISFDLFEQRTGLSITQIADHLRDLEDDQLIKINDKHIEKTLLGHRYLNNITEKFLTD